MTDLERAAAAYAEAVALYRVLQSDKGSRWAEFMAVAHTRNDALHTLGQAALNHTGQD